MEVLLVLADVQVSATGVLMVDRRVVDGAGEHL